MESIKIVATGTFLPSERITNEMLAKQFAVTPEFIKKRTGIENRFQVKEEMITDLAINAVENLLGKTKRRVQEVQMILVGTTTTDKLMPGISYLVQKHFKIPKAMCMDILAGCNSYVNCFDIARNYIAMGIIENALIIGVDILSKFTNKEDLGTAILFSDGAGATWIEKAEEEKDYCSYIVSDGEKGDILTCTSNSDIYMDGKEIYKYAITETVKNLHKLCEKAEIEIQDINYIIPHQSNLKIMESICNRLQLPREKMYTNIEQVGNSFCASIPIALDEMFQKNLLKEKDKVILLGYGGGLNTGSILLEI